MSENIQVFKDFTLLFLEALKEENKQSIAQYIFKKSENFTKLKSYNFKDFLDSRNYLLKIGEKRDTADYIRVVLKKIPDDKLEFKEFQITFVDIYKGYNILKRNQSFAKQSKINKSKNTSKLEANTKTKPETYVREKSDILDRSNLSLSKESTSLNKSSEKSVLLNSFEEKLKNIRERAMNSNNDSFKTELSRTFSLEKNDEKVPQVDRTIEAVVTEDSTIGESEYIRKLRKKVSKNLIRYKAGDYISPIKSKSDGTIVISPDKKTDQSETSIMPETEKSISASDMNKRQDSMKEKNKNETEIKSKDNSISVETIDSISHSIRNNKSVEKEKQSIDKIDSIENDADRKKNLINNIGNEGQSPNDFIENGKENEDRIDKRKDKKQKVKTNDVKKNIFANKKVKYLKHKDEIKFQYCTGNYIRIDASKQNFYCKNQKSSVFKVCKKDYDEENIYVRYGEQLRISTAKDKYFLALKDDKVCPLKISDSDLEEDNLEKNIINIDWKFEPPLDAKNKKMGKIPLFSKAILSNVKEGKYICEKDGQMFTNNNLSKISEWCFVSRNNGITIPTDKFCFEMFDYSSVDDDDDDGLVIPHEKNKEKLVIEKLLLSLMGICDGKCFSFDKKPKINCQIDLSEFSLNEPSKDLIHRFVPIIENHLFIKYFVSERSKFNYGLVSQMFCKSLEKLMLSYYTFISQLELKNKNDFLMLQELLYLVQPAVILNSRIKQLCFEFLDKERSLFENNVIKGGMFLNVIIRFCENEGDPKIRKIIKNCLLKPSLIPYINFIKDWVSNGEIHDPFDEFIVVRVGNSRFELREDNQSNPLFLEETKALVFKVGKLKLMLKQMNINDTLCDNVEYLTESDLSCLELINEKIKRIYVSLNTKILHLIRDKKELLKSMRTIKKLFLLGRGDLYKNFFAFLKTRPKISKTLLAHYTSIFEQSVQSCENVENQFTQFVKIELCEEEFLEDLRNHLDINIKFEDSYLSKRKDVFTLSFVPNWPLSLFYTVETIEKYSLLFRYLLIFKQLEANLNNNWLLFKTTRISTKSFLSRAHFFNKKISCFLRKMNFYLQFNVIQSAWKNMEEQIVKEESSFDRLVEIQDEFLSVVFKKSFLTEIKIIEQMLEVVKLISEYFAHSEKMWEQWVNKRREYERESDGKYEIGKFLRETNYEWKIDSLSKRFDISVKSIYLSADLISNSSKDYSFLSKIEQMIDFPYYLNK